MIETTAGESHQHNATLERRMAEKSLLRKLDILILPLLSLSYLLAYMVSELLLRMLSSLPNHKPRIETTSATQGSWAWRRTWISLTPSFTM